MLQISHQYLIHIHINILSNMLLKDNETIAKPTLHQEMAIRLNRLAHECKNICNEINIQEVTKNNVLFKCQIKSAVEKKHYRTKQK